MSGLLAFTKMAFAAPRLTMAVGVNTMAVRGYAIKKLFVGNIAWGTEDNEVLEVLGKHGKLTDSYFPKDYNGRTKGYGFVELEEEEVDHFLQQTNGIDFNGRELRVDVANPRPDRAERPRGEFQGEFRPRRDFDRDGGDRQFRPRRDNYNNQRGGERSYRPRGDGRDNGERSYRSPREDRD
ncbi:hypothetical protein EDD11_003761 [Mortierella claussenii]|nr:hypothetical protein EDD11_003761 [Mortierella claussenii]